jgi:hypothetical protein
MNTGEAVHFKSVLSRGRFTAERAGCIETIKRQLELFFHEIILPLNIIWNRVKKRIVFYFDVELLYG